MSNNERPARRISERPGPWDATPPPTLGSDPVHALDPSREPLFRAPMPVVVLVGLLLASYGVQTLVGSDPVVARFAFAPARLADGGWSGLVTALFVHGGWAHVVMNALGALAFGAPVARRLGPGGQGAVGFLAFYLACGALSCLGYALVHPGSPNLLVGASGAVSGLMGAASRLLEHRSPDETAALAPFASRTVIGMAVGWIVVNALIAVVGFAPGTGGAPVAWEAHLFGYAAGLLLLGPAARVLGARRGPSASSDVD